jgi:hypothetical protein
MGFSGGMATLAASNVAGVLTGKPVLPTGSNTLPFVDVSHPTPLNKMCSSMQHHPVVPWRGWRS